MSLKKLKYAEHAKKKIVYTNIVLYTPRIGVRHTILIFLMIIKKYASSYKLYIHSDNETYYLTLNFFFSIIPKK